MATLARRGRRQRMPRSGDVCTRILTEAANRVAPDASGCAPQSAAPGSYADFRRALHAAAAAAVPSEGAEVSSRERLTAISRVIARAIVNEGPVDATLALFDDLKGALRSCEVDDTTRPCGVYAGPGENARYIGVVAVSIVGYGNAPWSKEGTSAANASAANATSGASGDAAKNRADNAGKLGKNTTYVELAKARVEELAEERKARVAAELAAATASRPFAAATQRAAAQRTKRSFAAAFEAQMGNAADVAAAARRYASMRGMSAEANATARWETARINAALPIRVETLLAGHARAADAVSTGAVLGGAPFWLVRHYWGPSVGLPGGFLVLPMLNAKLGFEATAGAGIPANVDDDGLSSPLPPPIGQSQGSALEEERPAVAPPASPPPPQHSKDAPDRAGVRRVTSKAAAQTRKTRGMHDEL